LRKSAFAVAIGGKRTSPIALHMSASDPKRTSSTIDGLTFPTPWQGVFAFAQIYTFGPAILATGNHQRMVVMSSLPSDASQSSRRNPIRIAAGAIAKAASLAKGLRENGHLFELPASLYCAGQERTVA